MDKTNIVRPPLGLKPKWLHDSERKIDIIEAMERYAKVKKPIPIEWIDELKQLIS
jgi:hypothetical protein